MPSVATLREQADAVLAANDLAEARLRPYADADLIARDPGPFTDAVIVRYVDDRMRSRVAGMRLTDQFAATLRLASPSGLAWHYELLPTESHPTILHAGALRALRTFFAAPKEAPGT